MASRDDILEQAMSLPPEDRAYLADHLEQSLTGDEFPRPETADAWLQEIERRIAAYQRGELQAISAEESLARIRERLVEQRARRM